MKRFSCTALGAVLLAGCASSSGPESNASNAPSAAVTASGTTAELAASAPATASATAPQPQAYASAIKAALVEVTRVRKLPVKEDVKSFSLSRDALLDKTKKKLKEKIPPGIVELQGEALRALELVPPAYDLEEGFLKLLQARVAGFYDPDEKAMYLIDDLSKAAEDETLPHELVHALQDQSFQLGGKLDYKPGKGDSIAAIQHLVEGDATLAGLLITYGDDFDADVDALRSAFFLSTAMSPVGAETPPAIISSLISPYTDGFGFAKALKDEGGWAAVDAALKKLPETTEQILHLDKYKAGEKPRAVPTIPFTSLGADYTVGIDETNGELGLRIMLEQWTGLKTATSAAAGWGGDRFVVLRGKGNPETFATVLYTKMDTQADAGEVAKILKKKLGTKCTVRPALGPIAWAHRGDDVVIVAGPHTKAKPPKSAGDCKLADAWLKEVLAAK